VKESLEETGNCLIVITMLKESSNSSEEFVEELEVERRLMIEDLMSGVSSPDKKMMKREGLLRHGTWKGAWFFI
jgi:hypothetical protein